MYAGNLDATFLGGPPSTQLDYINLNTILEVYRILDGCTSNGLQGCKTYYLGILVDQPTTVGYAGQTAGTPPTFISTAYLSNGLPIPHELGAAMGQLHTLCRGDEDQPTQTYPYPNAMISYDTAGDSAFYGFDVYTRIIYPPYTRDLMSHCQPRLESDWTYKSIMNHLTTVYASAPSAAPQAPVLQTGENAILVSGVITFTNDTGKFLSTYILPAPGSVTLPEPGEYTIRFENSSGTTLASYPFEPHVSSDDHTYGSFALLLPWTAGASRIVLEHGSQVLDTRGTSGNAPYVQVMYPNGGESLSGSSATVTWLGSDVDHDPLTYIVQYSKDAGATWQTLASGLTATTYNLDLTRLPGSNQAMIRVIASDGMYTAQDQSNGVFSVGRHAPQVQISQPANNATFAGDQSLVLEGSSMDVEDGALAGSTLTWSSNRDGVLGTGAMLVRSASTLQEGAHTITLQARDSDGQTSTSSVTVQVVRVQPVLPAHLSLAPTAMQFTAEVNSGQTDWQVVSIHNSGDGDLSWSMSVSAPWLLATADAGTTPADLLVAINPAGLTVGNYQGTLTIMSSEAENSPQTVTVRLAVTGPPPAASSKYSLYLPLILSNR